MGLGGYLAARTDAEHYNSERKREDWEIDNLRGKESTSGRSARLQAFLGFIDDLTTEMPC